MESKYENDQINDKWNTVKNIRKVITGALEKKRAEKIIGSSLEAKIKIYLDKDIIKKVTDITFDEVCITSSYELLPYDNDISGFALEEVEGVCIKVEKIMGQKCNRCWKYKETLNNNEICDRCEEVVKQ